MTEPILTPQTPDLPPTQPFGPRPPSRPPVSPPAPARAPGLRVAASLIVIVVALTGVGAAVTRHSSSAESSTAHLRATGAARAQQWSAVLRGLDLTRSVAFSTGRPALLDEVYAPTCGCLAIDRAALETVRRQGLRLHGLRLEIDSVRELWRGADTVTLRVADRIPAFTRVDATGSVVSRDPGRGLRTWDLTLVRAGAGWRIGALTSA